MTNTRSISVSQYIFEAMDKKRIVDEDGVKETWSEYFCRLHGLKYRPFGLPRPRGRPQMGERK